MNFFNDSDLSCHHTIDPQPNPDKFPMHAHYMYEIFYFIEGKGSYYVEGNSYKLQQNDILIMRQGETHKLQIDGSKPYERSVVHFSPSIFKDYPEILRPFNDRPLGRLNQFRESAFSTGHYISTFKLISNSFEANQPKFHLIAHLYSLVSEIYLAFDKQANNAGQYADNHVIVDIVDYINTHLFDNISLDTLSERFYLSKSQINRLFKKSTGSTVWEYILIKRLMKARDLIQQGSPALKASSKCGFRDYSSFYRAYKARFGCSPKSTKNNQSIAFNDG